MVGRQVGNYRVLRILAKGGMGVVYEAEHPVIGHRVAIKVLHPHICDNPSLVERFFTEARVVNEIKHPHIVSVRDLGQTSEGQHYLAMELLEGETLRQRLKRQRPLPLHTATTIAMRTADALAAAHGQGVVHRDVKPDNIFLAQGDTAEALVKVLDFGIAKLMDRKERTSSTEPGVLLGTLDYMSPEQLAAQPTVDHRSDIYSLGVVLFEMATGQRPFHLDGAGLALVERLQAPPPPPRSLAPQVPETLEAVILRALAKHPDDRFSSMERFRSAIEMVHRSLPAAPWDAASSGGEASDSTLTRSAIETDWPPLSQRVRRRRVLALGGAALLLTLVAVLVTVALRENVPPPDVATEAAARPAPPEPIPQAPVPSEAEVRVRSTPSGVDAYYRGDETPIGRTPFELTVPLGKLEIVFRKPGYLQRTERLDVRGDVEMRVTLELAPSPPATPRRAGKPRRAPAAKPTEDTPVNEDTPVKDTIITDLP